MARSLLLPGDKPLLNLALLGATLGTTGLAGYWQSGALHEAAIYAFAAVAILGTHEMGHYVLARWHGVDTTLPYFIPVPLGFGTLGAVIRIRSRIPHRNALVDIGAAGPLAGLAVAIPILIWGLMHSHVGDVPAGHRVGTSLLSVLHELFGYLASLAGGPAYHAPEFDRAATLYGDSLLMKGLNWLVFGKLPPGKEVFVHPAVIAGWFGLLVTTLNLCPIGQLDGGHLAYALFGRRAQWVGRAASAGLLVLTVFFSVSWLVWFLVTRFVIGFRHPEVVDPGAPLTAGRKLVCWIGFVSLALCVIPVPIQAVLL